MKILVTGASGFLGREILKSLKEQIVFTLNRNSGNYIYDLSKCVPNFNTNFDLIIHNAGRAHVIPKSKSSIASFYDTNLSGTQNLLRGLSNYGSPKRFVFISSVSVYGIISGCNISENNQLLADDPYGRSKVEAEQLVSEWCQKNNVLCTILRLPLVAGINPPGNLGAMINAIRKGYYFNVSEGVARKSMVLASDISKFILAAAEVGGVYNLTDGCHPKFNELSHLISKQLGKRFVPNMPLFVAKLLAFLGDKIGPLFPINSVQLNKITSTLTFDDSKARKAFGWNPTPVLKGFNIHE